MFCCQQVEGSHWFAPTGSQVVHLFLPVLFCAQRRVKISCHNCGFKCPVTETTFLFPVCNLCYQV